MILSKAKASEAAEAVQMMIDELRKQGFPTPTVQVFASTLSGSLSIHLHNDSGMRPTVYSVTTGNMATNINPVRLTLDTIVCENKAEHQCIKEHGGVGFISELLLKLAKQPARGTAEETAKSFTSLGLLYRKNDAV